MKKIILGISILLAAGWVSPTPSSGMTYAQAAHTQTVVSASDNDKVKAATDSVMVAINNYNSISSNIDTDSRSDSQKLKDAENKLVHAIIAAQNSGVTPDAWASVADLPAVKAALGVSSGASATEASAGSAPQADGTSDANAEEGDIEDDTTTSEDKKGGVPFSIMLWLIILSVAVVTLYYMLSKKTTQLKHAMHEDRDEASAKSDATRMAVNEINEKLSLELSTLRRQLEDANARINSMMSARNTASVAKAANPPKKKPIQKAPPSNVEVYYVDSLSQSGNGELSIPMRVMKTADCGELFKVTFNRSTGIGEYVLNPSSTNFRMKVDKLRTFTDGLTSLDGTTIKTVVPGELRVNGYDLMVVRKLIITCE